MPYRVSGCRYCLPENTDCACNCHTATQEDIEEGYGDCTPVRYD